MPKVKNVTSSFKNARTRALLIVVLVIIVIAVGIGLWSLRSKDQGVPAGAELRGAPSIESIPGVGKPSREYIKTQQEENILQAQQAAREGTAAIPTVTSSSYLGPSEFGQTGAATKEGCSAEELSRARAAGVKAEELRCRGCNAAQLRAAGYTAGELMNAGFSAKELRNAGFTAAELRAAGFTAAELARAGFSADELAAAGFSAAELAQAGITRKQLEAVGVSQEQMQAAGVAVTSSNLPKDCSEQELASARQRGVKAGEIRAKLGCTAGQLKAAGYDVAALKAAGFNAKELKDAVYTCRELKDIGFTAGELRLAGCSATELARLGFTAAELRDAGFSADELRSAGFGIEELKDAGFSNGELLRAGYSTDEVYPQAAAAPAPTPTVAAAPATAAPLTQESAVTIPSVTDEDAAAAAALERLQQRQAEQLSQQERQELLQQMETAMTTQANELFASWNPPPTQVYVHGEEEQQGGNQAQGQAVANAAAKAGTVGAQEAPGDIIKAGTVLFATLDTGINSDEQSPIMATVIQGPYKGAKLLGTFTRTDKKVVLSFTTMSMPSVPNSITVNAVAIDPNSARTAMASDVDNHYLLRYGTLFASALVSGWAKAVSESGSQESIGLGGVIVTHPQLSTSQQGMVALGEVGNQYSSKLSGNFTVPPTVKVDAGSGIGVLFMADTTIPTMQGTS